MGKRLVLIDGNAILHRAFHALPPLTTSKGEIVNAVFGFSSMLLKVISDLKPDFLAVTFDRKAPTFRHTEYAGYKAKRVKAPDELYSQFPRTKKVVKALNLPIFELDGYEADDLIGTIAKQAHSIDDKLDVLIVTGDLDTLQLIDDHTKVYTTRKGLSDIVIFDKDKVLERYGLLPEQMIDYKALRGDQSDNITGVPGIGEKTAEELLKKYKNIEGIYQHLGELPERIRVKLSEGINELNLSKRLVTIDCKAPIHLDLSKCIVGSYNRKEITDLFEELEFKSLIKKLPTKENLKEMPKEKVEEKPSSEQLKLV